MLPAKRVSTHPGEILREAFLKPFGATPTALAEHLGVPCEEIESLVREADAVTPELAWLLSQAFGTSPEFWMNLQAAHDLTKRRPRRRIEQFPRAS
jgi:antitoxin HigA-1